MFLNDHQSDNEFINKDCQSQKPKDEMIVQIVDSEMM
jgi:hypothetical protein